MYLNKVILCGKLCNDPELRYTNNGVAVTNFTLKTIESWKHHQSGEFRSNNKYHKCVCWGIIAKETCENIKKDNFVLLEGELSYHKYSKILNTGENIDIINTEVKATKVQKHNNEGEKDDAGRTKNTTKA